MDKIIVDNINFELIVNPYYNKSKYCYECKYKIMYYDTNFSSYRILYYCNNKREFTKKNIKKHLYYTWQACCYVIILNQAKASSNELKQGGKPDI